MVERVATLVNFHYRENTVFFLSIEPHELYYFKPSVKRALFKEGVADMLKTDMEGG